MISLSRACGAQAPINIRVDSRHTKKPPFRAIFQCLCNYRGRNYRGRSLVILFLGSILKYMERQCVFSIGEFYHVYNRGVEKRSIFIDKKDWARFHKLLYLANSSQSFVFRELKDQGINTIERGSPIVAIGAYVLMLNHFHILAKETTENGLSTFMKKLSTGYSMYFNKKDERVGPLFQGRFKAEHVSRDEHLKYLYAYIHLNPVKLIEPKWKETGIKNKDRAIKFIKQYHYSSYEDYCGTNRQECKIISKGEFPKYFSGTHSFKTYVNDWLMYQILEDGPR